MGIITKFTQNKFSCIPSYRVVGEKGPDHQKVFEVSVFVKQKLLGTGTGKNKKQAEQTAAQEALLAYNSADLPK